MLEEGKNGREMIRGEGWRKQTTILNISDILRLHGTKRNLMKLPVSF